jgi:hypothetical protein
VAKCNFFEKKSDQDRGGVEWSKKRPGRKIRKGRGAEVRKGH